MWENRVSNFCPYMESNRGHWGMFPSPLDTCTQSPLRLFLLPFMCVHHSTQPVPTLYYQPLGLSPSLAHFHLSLSHSLFLRLSPSPSLPLSFPVLLSPDSAVFGVTVEVAVQRSTLGTDQLELPTVFRQCIDFLEEHGTLTTSTRTHTFCG